MNPCPICQTPECHEFRATLTRTEQNPDGVFGAFIVTQAPDWQDALDLCSAEDDWLLNAARVSCIVAGAYHLGRTLYHKGGYEVFEVLTVPGRSRILIHRANTENDVEGCIAVGLRFDRVAVAVDEDTGATNVKKYGVVDSRAALADLMATVAGHDAIPFLVRWNQGLPHPPTAP